MDCNGQTQYISPRGHFHQNHGETTFDERSRPSNSCPSRQEILGYRAINVDLRQTVEQVAARRVLFEEHVGIVCCEYRVVMTGRVVLLLRLFTWCCQDAV